MADRLMRVTAHTTLDLVDAVATGHDFEEATFAVVDATADRESPDRVRLRVELDNMTETNLPAHVTDLGLTPEQARTLAADLEDHAARVERARGDDGE
ncbi:DUF6360 family protein [Salinilacihabitans rarus]|uniref:DUF6360 family protein n=1 Tax=Salinilacihabitans rarus TaxID=2961596 RepID=UPI0020C843A8|nr:DUF6360 family protein [Salinilacihabitans rarus]